MVYEEEDTCTCKSTYICANACMLVRSCVLIDLYEENMFSCVIV